MEAEPHPRPARAAGAGDIRRLTRLWFGCAVLLHLITAYRSEGFFHPDEHFQILEFMNAYLGRSPYRDLPWEYAHHMRAWIQPWTFAQLAKSFQLLGISNPFTWALLFRLISALLGLGVLWGLLREVPRWISAPRIRKWVVIMLCTLWVICFRDVRPSSEAWSGDFFAFALLLSLREGPSQGALRWIGAGALLGLAFEFRFPTGVLIAGLALWHVLIRKTPRRCLGWAAAGFLAVVAFGAVLDRMGYGVWCLPAWDFVYQNLVLGKTARFSSEPWWWYLARSSEYLPPLTTVIFLLGVAGLFVRPRHPLTWSIAPFVLVHFLIADKQLRFFFPVIAFAPVLCGFAAQRIGQMWQAGAPRVWKWLKPVLVAENALALLVVVWSAPTQVVPFWHDIYSQSLRYPRAVLYSSVKAPYELYGLKVHYYRPPALQVRDFPGWKNLARDTWRQGGTALVFVHYSEALWNATAAAPALRSHCRLLRTTVPEWLMRLDLGAHGWIRRGHWWALYRCGWSAPPAQRPADGRRGAAPG